jgi:peptidoglycan/LPS O-acetylase OafA/YrhL
MRAAIKTLAGPGLFRFFLALVVFVHHTTRFAVGSAAVCVFFCLSGYWIDRMYMGRYSAARQPYLTYLVSRVWRLLPAFLLVTVGTLIYLRVDGSLADYWHASSSMHFVLSNLFILGYNSLTMQPLVPAWSLDIELQFYLVAPLLVIILAMRKLPPWSFLLAAAAVSLAWALLGAPVSVVNYLVFFLAGMVAASSRWSPSRSLALGSLGATALLLLLCIASPWRGALLIGANPGPFAVHNASLNIALGLLLLPFAIYTTTLKDSPRDTMFGDLSYILYLLHWPVCLWIAAHPGGIGYRIVTNAAGLVLTLGLSYLMWRFYDRPINRLRSRWVNGRRKSTPLSATR